MWRIEYDPSQLLLTMRLREHVNAIEMRSLGQRHADALEATGGEAFRVLVDLRGLHPLDAESAGVLSDMKRVAAQLVGYRGRAVLVDSPTIAMQQHNTTFEEGGDECELITDDLEEALGFLERL